MEELDNKNVVCEFCSKPVKFINSKQVILKIDKFNNFQNLFAIICNDCENSGKKKTVNGQLIKNITNRNKLKNEESIFDTVEGE